MTPWGKSLLRNEILSASSIEATSMSVPRSNDTVTLLEPFSEVEEISFTPSTSRAASSMGLVTCSQTASGSAPGHMV